MQTNARTLVASPIVALILALTPVAQAQTASVPMISYTLHETSGAIAPIDVREMEISTSGDQTDVFLRLFDTAGQSLSEATTRAEGGRLTVSICEAGVLEVESLSPMTTGTLYIPNLTFVQADALRSIWHGRATCSTLPPEVFPSGQ